METVFVKSMGNKAAPNLIAVENKYFDEHFESLINE